MPDVVLIVQDEPSVRARLFRILVTLGYADDKIICVGDIAQAKDVAGRRGLEMVLADLRLPDGDGITLGTELKQRWPDLRVLILTMHAAEATVIQSLASGLDGYLLKDADPEDVLAAVHSAAGGAMVVGRSVSAFVAAAAASAPRTDALAVLDARDLEILELMVDGLPTSQVAARLYLAPKTIRNRVSEMLGKLGVATREDAITLGRAAGLGVGRLQPPQH